MPDKIIPEIFETPAPAPVAASRLSRESQAETTQKPSEKIIFVDIIPTFSNMRVSTFRTGGVSESLQIDNDAVAGINTLCEKTGAKLVLSGVKADQPDTLASLWQAGLDPAHQHEDKFALPTPGAHTSPYAAWCTAHEVKPSDVVILGYNTHHGLPQEMTRQYINLEPTNGFGLEDFKRAKDMLEGINPDLRPGRRNSQRR